MPRVIDCGSCLVGGIKVTLILCRNEGFSTGKFCIMPKKAWPPPNFRVSDRWTWYRCPDVKSFWSNCGILAHNSWDLAGCICTDPFPQGFTFTLSLVSLAVCTSCMHSGLPVEGVVYLLRIKEAKMKSVLAHLSYFPPLPRQSYHILTLLHLQTLEICCSAALSLACHHRTGYKWYGQRWDATGRLLLCVGGRATGIAYVLGCSSWNISDPTQS